MKQYEIKTGLSPICWNTDWAITEPQCDTSGVWKRTLQEALDNPVGSLHLEELTREAKHPVVVLPDATRSWQNIPLMVRAVSERLRGAGCNAVTWVIGVGTHHPATEAEMQAIFGGAIPEGDILVSHDCTVTQDLGLVTKRGTEVCVNPHVANADFVLFIGGIVFHDLAGFSGGRKALFPGVAAKKSIENNHSLGFWGDGFHPEVACGVLEGNPIHEDMMEFLSLYLAGRRSFLLNVIPDGSGEPCSYIAGDVVEGWAQGVSEARKLQTLWADAPPDLVVVSCGGAPFDLDLYQGSKSLSAIEPLLREKTAVLLVADLPDGMGTVEYDEVMRLALEDLPSAMDRVRKNFSIPGYIAAKNVSEYMKYPMALVTPNKQVAFPGYITPNFEDALEFLTFGKEPARVLLIRSGNAVHVDIRGEIVAIPMI